MKITFKDRDEFKREGIAKKLLALFESETEASPVVLDGPWGSGKTEFCQKFMNLSSQQKSKLKCLYIDAFKFDHSEDPLLMLITSLSSLVENETTKKDLIKKAIPVAKVLGKVAGKAALSWALKTSADAISEDLSDAMSSESDDLIDEGIKKLFKNFEKIDENLKSYKSALSKLAQDQPILIIIDELDRCQPLFALSLLEKIKHVFDIKGIKFLFATNLPQLCSIVKKQYGYDVDAETYLAKFFNFTVRLPSEHTPNNHEFFHNGFRLFSNLIASNNNFKKISTQDTAVSDFIKFLFEKDERSLRDAETFYRNLNIFNSAGGALSINENTLWSYTALMMLSVYIYTFDSTLAAKILNKKYTEQDISTFFNIPPHTLKTRDGELNTLIYALFILDLDESAVSQFVNENEIKLWDQEIYKIFNSYGRNYSGKGRITIVQKAIRTMQLL